ncbi:hypothetical protein [Dactylosporangium darangshiense]|uniref:Uncharacterized protein n=1 Tax=Dactylosporangium darangshiense TaxID=579108 RepID=A0ABP8D8U0_9ACTN
MSPRPLGDHPSDRAHGPHSPDAARFDRAPGLAAADPADMAGDGRDPHAADLGCVAGDGQDPHSAGLGDTAGDSRDPDAAGLGDTAGDGRDLDTAEVVIDLDRPVAAAPRPREPRARSRRGSRVALVGVLALAAFVPQAEPAMLSAGRTVPLPSYCTGTPIPGGRLNIIQGDHFIILDATTNTIVNEGRCPHGTGKRFQNTGK